MIMREFEKWIENVKSLIEKRVEGFADVWLENIEYDSISVGITFPNGQTFWMLFDQEEFNYNNKNQRRSLAKVRRKDLAWHIEDFAKTLIKTAKALNI